MQNTENDEKPKHPRQNANPLSVLTFSWTIPIFIKGFKKTLEEEDLYDSPKTCKSHTLGNKLEKNWDSERKERRVPSLWRALSKIFIWDFIFSGLLFFFIEIILNISQQIALAHLIAFYNFNKSENAYNEALISGSLIILITFCRVLVGHSNVFIVEQLGMKLRIACSSLLYRKLLKLNEGSFKSPSSGQIINLLTNDMNKFDMTVLHLHYIWLAPIQVLVILYFLFIYFGFTACIGVFFLILSTPLQVYLSQQLSKLRFKIAQQTDQRVRLISEIISGIQLIKMCTWEQVFINATSAARRLEMNKIGIADYIRAFQLSFTLFSIRLAVFLSILCYILLGNSLNAQYVFVIMSFTNLLRHSVTVALPIAINHLAEVKVSAERITEFLLKCDSEDIIAKEVKLPKILTDVLKTDAREQIKTEFIAVVGQVGCGKTTLLHEMLQQSIKLGRSVSYAAQESWIFAGSIEENILFGKPMNTKRYQEVIKVCALERDLALFPYADHTIVGDRGATLSGGQKARVNLARAIYNNADVYLLDDPLSAVDTHVGKQLFDECITGFLTDKCVILVTHQLQYLKNANKLIALANGTFLEYGTYKELIKSNLNLIKEFAETDEGELSVNDKITTEINGDIKTRTTVIPNKPKEYKESGSIKNIIYMSYLKFGGNICLSLSIFVLIVLAQVFASSSDYFLAYWVNLEQLSSQNISKTIPTIEVINERHNFEQASSQNISKIIPTIEVTNERYFHRNVCIIIYSTLVTCTVVVTLFRSYSLFLFAGKASKNLHNAAVSNIIHSTMTFFNNNTSGVILNRFSNDIGAIDEILPYVTLSFLQNGLTALGIVTVVTIVNTFLAIPAAIMIILFYVLKILFLKMSRNVKRLESTTRSPVLTHVQDTVRGWTTIKAFQSQMTVKNEFDIRQDVNSSAFFISLACTRAFGFVLDLISTIYLIVIVLNYLVIADEQFGGNVGLAITQATSLVGMLQWGIRQWIEFENQMITVERVVEYTTLQQESKATINEIRTEWPMLYGIIYQNVSLTYSNKETYALKNITFHIKSNEKVGVVGRTGAGKSSLISALFQLASYEGTIIIDKIDTQTVPLKTLRSKISIIPQEPILFSGTLRKNLDPFDEFLDSDLWTALEDVELKGVIQETMEGLSSCISENGANFSVGQRQLICLARAIVRKNKILVMDEATSNVDPQTDSLIQATVRTRFVDCTVIIIAHRLNTVMDCDKVLVMDDGQVKEFDHPYVLLQRNDGVFYKMVQQTGSAMMMNLMKIARVRYEAAALNGD